MRHSYDLDCTGQSSADFVLMQNLLGQNPFNRFEGPRHSDEVVPLQLAVDQALVGPGDIRAYVT